MLQYDRFVVRVATADDKEALLLGEPGLFFTTDPKQIHFSYRRYLENELRQAFGFEGTPLRISFRNRHEDL